MQAFDCPGLRASHDQDPGNPAYILRAVAIQHKGHGVDNAYTVPRTGGVPVAPELCPGGFWSSIREAARGASACAGTGTTSMRQADPLDNPIWSSLCSRHRALALRAGEEVARYPSDFAPFLGVARAGMEAAGPLQRLVAPGESVVVAGVVPAVPPGWRLQTQGSMAQMVCSEPIEQADGPEMIALGEAHRADVLALVALVYPHYFRPRTMELGRYLGIYHDGRLAAMAGERMGTEDSVEISAICTHPDFLGRGHARRLTACLVNDLLQQGRMPFLHVSHANTRARRLYEWIGFRTRRDLGLWSLSRPQDMAQ